MQRSLHGEVRHQGAEPHHQHAASDLAGHVAGQGAALGAHGQLAEQRAQAGRRGRQGRGHEDGQQIEGHAGHVDLGLAADMERKAIRHDGGARQDQGEQHDRDVVSAAAAP